MKWISAVLVSFILFIGLFMMFPYLWKLSGGTFITGNKIVYEGRTLMVTNGNCSISATKDFVEISVVCEDTKTLWVNGIEQKN